MSEQIPHICDGCHTYDGQDTKRYRVTDKRFHDRVWDFWYCDSCVADDKSKKFLKVEEIGAHEV